MNQATGLLISALLTACATLLMFVYKDIVRRLQSVEKKSSANLMVLLLMMGKLDGTIPVELLVSIKEAMANGK